MRKNSARPNALSWLENLYEIGTLRNRASDLDDVEVEIARHVAEAKRLRKVAREAVKRAEREALKLGWSPGQVKAAKQGEMLPWTDEQVRRFKAEGSWGAL